MIKVDRVSIETCMWHIQRYLMLKYGTNASCREIAPLSWYINSGRASLEFIRLLMAAKPFMVARKLHQGGSYDEALARVKNYLGYSTSD